MEELTNFIVTVIEAANMATYIEKIDLADNYSREDRLLINKAYSALLN